MHAMKMKRVIALALCAGAFPAQAGTYDL